MKPIDVFAACLAAVLTLACNARGQEVKFQKYNFAITAPDRWKQKHDDQPKPGQVVTFVKPDGTAMLIVTVDENIKPDMVMDDSTVGELNKGLEQGGGGNFLSGRFMDVRGIKAYERIAQTDNKGKVVSTIVRMVPANGILYGITGVRFDGDATQLMDLQDGMDSFRFLKDPPNAVSSKPPPGFLGKWAGNRQVAIGVALGGGFLFFLVIVYLTRKYSMNSRWRGR